MRVSTQLPVLSMRPVANPRPRSATFVTMLLALPLALLIAVDSDALRAQEASTPVVDNTPVRYEVSFPEPHTHYANVVATFPATAGGSTELFMAVWTPGSYLVREYARHVEDLVATTIAGAALPIEKTRKNRWLVTSGSVSEFKVSYRIYCREMSVRTNWVEERFALLNGAPSFLTLHQQLQRPHEVKLRLPVSWKRSLTGLAAHPDGALHHYRAADFDILVDSPILCGNPEVHEFKVAEVPHFFVNLGGKGIWDSAAAAADVEKVVRSNHELWRNVPYSKYVFLNLIVESGGGLEHRNSTVMMTSRWQFRIPKSYQSWLGLVSHEFFHTWNVKRLRPKELGPFDYENEVYTENLWIVEGITSYYDDLLVRRAQLCSTKEYLANLSKQIEGLQKTPGRQVQPLSRSSYDAWIKHYRRDENSRSSSVSYYTKGAVVGFLLDAKIQELTQGRANLDEVLRRAYGFYSGETGYTRADFQGVVSSVCGTSLDGWFSEVLDGTAELNYQQALDWYGLAFKSGVAKSTESSGADGSEAEEEKSAEEKKPKKGWLGERTRNRDGRLIVSEVERNTPAHRYGLNVDDEIIAIDDFRVTAKGWTKRLEQYPPGSVISLLVARRQELLRLAITLEEAPKPTWKLELRKDATAEQKARLSAWLHSVDASSNGQEPAGD